MNKIKNESGITLIALTVTIVVMMILIIGISAVMTTNIEIENYNKVKEDIVALTEAVKLYYLQNSKLPIVETPTISRLNIPTKDINPNDNNRYYYINTSLLTDVQLNCGKGNTNKTYTSSDNDLYVLNEKSLTVYYLKGAVLDGQKHYTVVDDFQGGGFATDYYSKTNLPIISAVTMESSGADKTIVQPGETVTLKILLNYELTKKPTVKINNTVVTVTWDGKIGTASYTFAETPTDADLAKNGAEVPFSIYGYTADGRTGSTITQVNFGKKVYISTGVKSSIKIGDYVEYTPATAGDYVLTTEQSGTASNQTIKQENLKWRVLSVDKNTGKIEIISDVTTTDVQFKSENTYNNGVYLLNKICASLYGNSAKGITARSVNLVDFEKNLTDAGFAVRSSYATPQDGYKYGSTVTYPASHSFYPEIYKEQIGAGINTSSVIKPDLNKTIDPYGGSKDNGKLVSGYGKGTSLTTTMTYYDIEITKENFGDVASVLQTTNPYWLASRVNVNGYANGNCYFGLDYVNAMSHIKEQCTFYSGNHHYDSRHGMRTIALVDESCFKPTKNSNGAWVIQ